MAKFKVGEKARYVGPVMDQHCVGLIHAGDEVTIVRIGYVHETEGLLYEIDRRGSNGWPMLAPEIYLEKLLPGHQEDDLKAADPLFIQSQLPRWLHQEEKKHERV